MICDTKAQFQSRSHKAEPLPNNMKSFLKSLEDLATNTNVDGTVRKSSLRFRQEPFEFNEVLYEKDIL